MKNTFTIIAITLIVLSVSQVHASVQGNECTMDYNPVCGETPAKACLALDCAIHNETYSNKCMMENAGSTFLYEGKCKTKLPEATDDKYYVGDTQKCMIIKYRCDEGYTYFGDSIGCGCLKESVTLEMKIKIDAALDSFIQRLEVSNYSQNKINIALSKLSVSLQNMREAKPKYRDIINYTLEKLDSY